MRRLIGSAPSGAQGLRWLVSSWISSLLWRRLAPAVVAVLVLGGRFGVLRWALEFLFPAQEFDGVVITMRGCFLPIALWCGSGMGLAGFGLKKKPGPF